MGKKTPTKVGRNSSGGGKELWWWSGGTLAVVGRNSSNGRQELRRWSVARELPNSSLLFLLLLMRRVGAIYRVARLSKFGKGPVLLCGLGLHLKTILKESQDRHNSVKAWSSGVGSGLHLRNILKESQDRQNSVKIRPSGVGSGGTLRVTPSSTGIKKQDKALQDGDKRRSHGAIDDVTSTITSDGLAVIHKKFYIPNEVLIITPKISNRVYAPLPGFITIYEMTLHVGLWFPPAPELLEIFKACGISLPQFLYIAIIIMVGLTVFFRERGAILTIKYLSKMCKFMTDIHGRVSCQNNKKWLDFLTHDPSKNWSNSFFFVKNEWENLQHELHYISECVTEECLFKVGLSIQVGRSHAIQLKNFKKSPEVKSNILKRSASHSSKGQKIIYPSSLKKRKANYKVIMPRDGSRCKEVVRPLTIDTVSLDLDREARSSKIHIPEDVLKHFCIWRHYAIEIIQHLTQEAYEKLFDVEVKDLKRQSLEEGTRGFLKEVRLVHHKTGVIIEGLIPSQASKDSPTNSGDDGIKSELKKNFNTFALPAKWIELRKNFGHSLNPRQVARPGSRQASSTDRHRASQELGQAAQAGSRQRGSSVGQRGQAAGSRAVRAGGWVAG
ncbi:hypothetical protein IEQ34_022204 [Dendrobium chrysotoxum]|uniref:Uncharacterized protein n=1 Tax=Dendrobium chrysotoxum TaxID=161865 RepID=A0AAV7FX50_DENCH|nr:hypothetical protein IEQ34_022204 [Dendrobium chrysotoxum]